ncbi:acyltransferase [Pedobacter miscanthi]|uniref:acyltransferase family protein n=1 Tax=Pedobacter miscanthi TaxID=2259170 RepID=UPI00292D9244|nr:acyltransferase [Pedobacter miscanthi]
MHISNPSLKNKPHFTILDGLRGVAAMIVVAFHIFEPNASSSHDQIINHGYLAVDFFFILSGFVIGYAYDDRWDKLTVGGFFKRRLERLQPMVIMGMIIGALLFYYSDSPKWPLIHTIPIWSVILTMIIGFTLLPMPPAFDIRGWQEMHPLNGPGWSLFYEYIANILYALGLRKLSKTALGILVAIFGLYLVYYAVTSPSGDLMGGWTFNYEQLHIGFTRLLFPFFGGLLLSRMVTIGKLSNSMLISSLMISAILFMPRIGGEENRWMNGLYESLSIVLIFPLIIYIGASGQVTGKIGNKVCKFLGDISYPIYITHFPLIYLYSAWISKNPNAGISQKIAYGGLTFLSALLIGYFTLKFYDEPVRKWLRKRFGNA